MKQIAKLSGGVMRDLTRSARLSTDTDENKIGPEDVQFAANTLIRQYDRLLNLRLILEYRNGER